MFDTGTDQYLSDSRTGEIVRLDQSQGKWHFAYSEGMGFLRSAGGAAQWASDLLDNPVFRKKGFLQTTFGDTEGRHSMSLQSFRWRRIRFKWLFVFVGFWKVF